MKPLVINVFAINSKHPRLSQKGLTFTGAGERASIPAAPKARLRAAGARTRCELCSVMRHRVSGGGGGKGMGRGVL